MLLKTSLTTPKDMLTVYIKVMNSTARMTATPVAIAAQPIEVLEKLLVVMGSPGQNQRLFLAKPPNGKRMPRRRGGRGLCLGAEKKLKPDKCL
jgi:hypothetical protein